MMVTPQDSCGQLDCFDVDAFNGISRYQVQRPSLSRLSKYLEQIARENLVFLELFKSCF